MAPANPRWRPHGAGRSVLLAGLAAAALLAATLATTWAAPALADPTPTATTTATPSARSDARPLRDDYSRLEALLQRAREALERQDRRLDMADEAAARIEGRIDEEKAKGADTSALASALAAFEAAVASARGSHDGARAALDAGAGFDAGGKMTDPAQARSTLEAVRDPMQRADGTLRQARVDLQQALWRVGLERQLQRVQAALGILERWIARANEMVSRVQGRIDEQKARGRDTSKAEAALAGFKAALSSAQSRYDGAKSTLDARSGFDASGKVTDPAQARSTLSIAREQMGEARRTLREAVVEAVKEWRRIANSE